MPILQDKTKPVQKLGNDAQRKLEEGTEVVQLKLAEVTHRAKKESAKISFKIEELRKSHADKTITPLLKKLEKNLEIRNLNHLMG